MFMFKENLISNHFTPLIGHRLLGCGRFRGGALAHHSLFASGVQRNPVEHKEK